jgi:hypothetical protein
MNCNVVTYDVTSFTKRIGNDLNNQTIRRMKSGGTG